MFTVGMRITLEMEQHGEREQYTSKLMEYNKKYLFITYPTHSRKSTTAFVPDGEKVFVSIVADNNIVYEFTTEVLGRKRIKKVPVLYLRMPHTSEIRKIQRRQYVRVDSKLDVAVYPAAEHKEPLITRSVDISGGGLAVVAKNDGGFEPGEPVQLTIVLPFKSDHYEYVDCPGEIIRYFTDKHHPDPRISIKFTDIKDEDREKIIKFIFEKQLEERRKLAYSQHRRKRL